MALYIAYKLMGEKVSVDTRFLAGSNVDEEVMKEIQEILGTKNY
jgi:hypothetical protein